jgi:hypothetical protein
MWFAPLAQLLALVATTAEAGPPSPPQVFGPLPPAIATRQTLFAIPFKIDKDASRGNEPVGVRLYVSSDFGHSWYLYQQVPPGRGRFLFQAKGDGEFWFLIRTIDRAGQLHPRQSRQPGLRVVVDTSPPDLKLQASRGSGGQVTTRWQATDPNLNLESLKIQYRPAGGTVWQPLAIDLQATTAQGITRMGEITWLPQAAGKRLEIRAEVADTAGNTTVSHAQLEWEPPVAAASGPPSGPSLGPSTAMPEAGPPAASPAAPIVAPPPADTTQPGEGPVIPGFSMAQPPADAVAAPANPPLANQYVPPPAFAVPVPRQLPDGRRPRVVNSRIFELEYKVDSVGPSGIRRVELWGTIDGGRTWTSYGPPKQVKSPLVVGVQHDGLYGFRVVVENGAGVWSGRPRPGDPPDVWVAVDSTRPSVHIRDVRSGGGVENQLRTSDAADSAGASGCSVR